VAPRPATPGAVGGMTARGNSLIDEGRAEQRRLNGVSKFNIESDAAER
jgi:hypothetical protein